MTILQGGCRCGKVRYQIDGGPKFSFACHCTDCQQLSSSAFSLALVVAAEDFKIVEGDPRDWSKIGSSGKPSHQFSCPICAGWTHTIAESAEGIVIVRPMTLHDHSWYRPVAEIFTRSALPWARMAVLLSYEVEFSDAKPLVAAYKSGGIGPGPTPN